MYFYVSECGLWSLYWTPAVIFIRTFSVEYHCWNFTSYFICVFWYFYVTRDKKMHQYYSFIFMTFSDRKINALSTRKKMTIERTLSLTVLNKCTTNEVIVIRNAYFLLIFIYWKLLLLLINSIDNDSNSIIEPHWFDAMSSMQMHMHYESINSLHECCYQILDNKNIGENASNGIDVWLAIQFSNKFMCKQSYLRVVPVFHLTYITASQFSSIYWNSNTTGCIEWAR